jgi:hypothetical protein
MSGKFSLTRKEFSVTGKVDRSDHVTVTKAVLESGDLIDSHVMADTDYMTTDKFSETERHFKISSRWSSTRRHSISRAIAQSQSFSLNPVESASPESVSGPTVESHSDEETDPSPPGEYQVQSESEKRPITGLFFSIGLLIIAGISFWVRSAYVETVIADPNRQPGYSSEDEYT